MESPYSPPPSTKPARANKDSNSVIVKAKLRHRFRQFEVPVDFPLPRLTATLKEKFDMVDETGASVMTAYMLWLFLGLFGIHRWYLKQHNATSFCIWFFTGQLFVFGWLYDGIMLASNVSKFNSRTLYKSSEFGKDSSGFMDLLFGFKEESRPSMVAAYLLWFFFGWMGIHRWYTGYHTPSSFLAWQATGLVLGFGWLYDGYHTSRMVNYPKMVANDIPFYVKALEKYDYLPVNSDLELESVLTKALAKPDHTLRILIVEKKREGTAYLLWVFFGFFGAHAIYLNMELILMRMFTANFFVLGWIADGIRLDQELERANKKIEGDFSPSLEGRSVWPSALGAISLGASPFEHV
eukprot:Phypoly_transcript_10998.p1 GENE.Phypoly_transcript_10998~~Phypoly_transcript_10998.p1  ORF type:complete len:387 (+),score=58.08 Phypoly_transcript_10998:108-1163(+)